MGSRWSNFAESISTVDEMSVAYICLMFLLNIILYMSLTLYFENVIPSEYGVRKPFYFIFKVSHKLNLRTSKHFRDHCISWLLETETETK